MGHYEFIDHTADIAVKAYGSSLEEAFATAGEAMFDIITGVAPMEAKEKVKLSVESIDTEGLLVGFLSKLILLYEIDQLVLMDFQVTLTGDCRLEASGWGEAFDEIKHCHGHHVKGVSYHMMEIFDGKGIRPSYVQVLFDV